MALLLVLLAQAGPHFAKTDDVRPFERGRRLVAAYGTALDEFRKGDVDVALVPFPADIKAVVDTLGTLDGPRVAPAIDASCKDLAAAARDFYSLVPPRHWAIVDERPIVWLPAVDAPRALDLLRETFEKGIARTPFVVAELSWKDTKADARYAAGAAARELDVVTVAGGAGYEKSWYIALRIQPRFVAIESWSKEHMEPTSKYADKLRRGEGLMLPKGPWTGERNVNWQVKYAPFERGLKPVSTDDGLFEKVELAGIEMITTKANKLGTKRCLYFDVDDSWQFWEKRTVAIVVEFLDQGQGSFVLEYDSADAKLELPARAQKSAGEVGLGGTGEWKQATFPIGDAYFAGRLTGGADFRLVVDKRGLAVRRVVVRGGK
jgi:hypothetical protein